MNEYNNLTVEIYEPFSTTRRAGSLETATIQRMSTYFPGGLFGTATVIVPYDITDPFFWVPGDRLLIRNATTVVWEGEIADIGYVSGGGADEGIVLECNGYWGALLGRRTIDRRWCDTRTSEGVWEAITSLSAGAEKCTIDKRDSRIRHTPKAVVWANNEFATSRYTMPVGETVGRVAGTYDFNEASNQYTYRCRDTTGATNFFNLTANANAAFDVDNSSGTNGRTLDLHLINTSGGNQTGVADGTEYGEVTGLKVYRYESGDATVPDVRIDNIVKDMQGDVSNVNSDTSYISTPGTTLDIEPFITDGPESWASVLERAASYGDGAFNEWYIRFLDSEKAASANGKPVVECAQYPALTTYDYGVRLDEPNLVPPLDIRRSAANIANWIVLRYRDTDEERDVLLTPDDDANLTDSTSTTDWGQRDLVVDLGESDTTAATNIGRRILASRKDAKFYVNGPITVRGYIRGISGNRVPASEIQAGKRIRIENYLTDLVGVSGAGLTFIITGTDYDDATETCRISTGVPDNLAVILAQLKLRFA